MAMRSGRSIVSEKKRSREALDDSNFDIHAAAYVSASLKRRLILFRTKLRGLSFGPMDHFFSAVPPQQLHQHIPDTVAPFRSYLSKFNRGSANFVVAYAKWYEWASYEAARGRLHGRRQEEPPSSVLNDTAVGKMVQERQHVRALLQMCLRHNSQCRKEGQHALINFLLHPFSQHLGCQTFDEFRRQAHHTLSYLLKKLFRGMASTNSADLIFCCDITAKIMQQTNFCPEVLMTLFAAELALDSRLAAAMRQPNEEESDPDILDDPSRSERNQVVTASIFGVAAVVSSSSLSEGAAILAIRLLCFGYIESRSIRCFSASILLELLRQRKALLMDSRVVDIVRFTFFRIPKVEYLRPEGVQLLVFLVQERTSDVLPNHLAKQVGDDALSPSSLEQLAAALFRRDQVTAVHPMRHPVWDTILEEVRRRCALGESLESLVSSFLNSVVVPYSRGVAELPRQVLFQGLVLKIGGFIMDLDNASERQDSLQAASSSVPLSSLLATPRPLNMQRLKSLSIDERATLLSTYIHQFRAAQHSGAPFLRRWLLRHIRSCLLAEVCEPQKGAPYVNEAVFELMRFGMWHENCEVDDSNRHRSIFLFADAFSFCHRRHLRVGRPCCTVPALDVVATYLDAEQRGETFFCTAMQSQVFRRARNAITESLDSSVVSSLFFRDQDMVSLLLFLFLQLSIDDPSLEEARYVATDVIPDLARFFQHGTIENINAFIDVLLVLALREKAASHVAPLTSFIRRLSICALEKCGRFIKTEQSMTILTLPLTQAFQFSEGPSSLHTSVEEGENSDGSASESQAAKSESGRSTPTEVDDPLDSEPLSPRPELSSFEDITSCGDEVDSEEEPTVEFLSSLKHFPGGEAGLNFLYPPNRDSTFQVLRAIRIVTRVALRVCCPYIVSVFQVLLAVMRRSVRFCGAEVFQMARGSVGQLMMSQHRFFGCLASPSALLRDIQSYCRKPTQSAVHGKQPKGAAEARKRLSILKDTALSVLHYLGYLAEKNDAGDVVREEIGKHYATIFARRDWDERVAQTKRDLFHFRQGFAWVFVPAAIETFSSIKMSKENDGKRYIAFKAVCTLLEAFFPRLCAISESLRWSVSGTIVTFLQNLNLSTIVSIGPVALQYYIRLIDRAVTYCSRVPLDPCWVRNIINELTLKDSYLLSAASIRVVENIQRSLGDSATVSDVKRSTPISILRTQSQISTTKRSVNRHAHANREKSSIVLNKLLAFRNKDVSTDEKLKRRQEHVANRQCLRKKHFEQRRQKYKLMSSEERQELKKRKAQAKAQRIAKDRARKLQLKERRTAAFEKWKISKLT